jgi:hypothetical protein
LNFIKCRQSRHTHTHTCVYSNLMNFFHLPAHPLSHTHACIEMLGKIFLWPIHCMQSHLGRHKITDCILQLNIQQYCLPHTHTHTKSPAHRHVWFPCNLMLPLFGRCLFVVGLYTTACRTCYLCIIITSSAHPGHAYCRHIPEVEILIVTYLCLIFVHLSHSHTRIHMSAYYANLSI